MSSRFLRLIPGLLVFLVLAAGCRTYGGYGTEPALAAQIQLAVQQFADDLERAKSDLEALSEAARQNSVLDPVETAYREVIVMHEEKLAAHRQIANRFQEEEGTYRALNRNYGAMISDQKTVRLRYNELHIRIRQLLSDQTIVEEPPTKAFYYVNPLYYDRVQNQTPFTMQEALRGL